MESFRNNFERIMEDAGVSAEAVDDHLDHNQTGLKKHYAGRDPMRAVKLMREPMMKVFSNPLITVLSVATGGEVVAKPIWGRQVATKKEAAEC
ncbi:MAG: hypothetical protein ABIH66_02740 [bacterium]